jgi:hypothetical protein
MTQQQFKPGDPVERYQGNNGTLTKLGSKYTFDRYGNADGVIYLKEFPSIPFKEKNFRHYTAAIKEALI